MTIYRIDLYFGTYTYDEVGNQISQTDANNHTTTFAYDSLGRRVKRTLPLGMSESYQYDAVGNQVQKTDFNARTTSYAYDNMNRMTQKTPDPSFSAVPITFTYTSTDQRASMTDQSGTSSFTYDNRDRLLTKSTPEGIITYTYDAQGNLLSMNSSNSNGTSVNYSYDTLNRLLTIQDNRLSTGNKMSTYTYDAVGNIATFIYSNGLETTYAYDTLNRLVNLHSTYGPTIASYAYTLGATGNRLSVTELSGRVVKYIYDAAYKLTNETITTDPNSINGIISYTYDPVGNRLTRNSTVSPVPNQTLTYDANDRLTSDGYDANGSTTSSGTNTYAYDFENHLINSNVSGGETIVYDGDGNRVSKTVGSTTTKYLIDELNPTGYAQVLEELTGGGVQRTYTYGLSRLTENQASGTSFYGYDGHGSVRFLMDESGTITDRYDYDAFGNLLHQTGTTPNVYLYSGEQLDSSLNLYNLRARYMNQNEGRFWTQDSYEGDNEEPSSLHKYLYVNDSPIDNIDPLGYDLISDATLGREVHAVISEDFMGKVPGGITNLSIGKIFGLPPGANLLRPDLVDPDQFGPNPKNKQLYEIKPSSSYLLGVGQLQGYIAEFNFLDPTGNWHPGSTYIPPSRIDLSSGYAIVYPPQNGVIRYDAYDYRILSLYSLAALSFGADLVAQTTFAVELAYEGVY